ncbi:MAG: NifU family protein [Nitrospirae bacterium]|nr:MAG: NifU family protein [Nitrospirota bacterium]
MSSMDKERFESVIEEIREGLRKEGGDLEVVDIREGIVYVRLTGQCESCMMAGLTMKNWVEKRLLDAFDEIKEVRAV